MARCKFASTRFFDRKPLPRRVSHPPTRKAFFEALEPRILLSADLATPDVASVFDHGVNYLETQVGAFFSGETLLDTVLPLVVESEPFVTPDGFNVLATAPALRDLLSITVDINRDGSIAGPAETALDTADIDNDGQLEFFDDVLKSLVFDEIASYLQPGSPVDNAGFVSFLNGLDASVGSNYGFSLGLTASNSSAADHVGFSLVFDIGLFQPLAFDLGLTADELAIATGGQSSLPVRFDLDFTLEIGVLTSGETPTNSDFFIDSSPLNLGFSVGKNAADAPVLLNFPDMSIGFLGVQSTGGTATIDADIEADFTDPSSATKLGFTTAQFGTGSSNGTLTAGTVLDNTDFGGETSLFLKIGSSDAGEVRIDTTGFNTSNLAGIENAIQTALDSAGFNGIIDAETDSGTLVLNLTTNPSALDITPLGFGSNQLGGNSTVMTASTALSDADVVALSGDVSFLLSQGHATPKLVTVNVDSLATVAQLVSAMDTALTTAGFTSVDVDTAPGGGFRLTSTNGVLEVSKTIAMNSFISYLDLNDEPVSSLLQAEVVGNAALNVNLPVTVKTGVGYSASTAVNISVPDIFALTAPTADNDGNIRFDLNFTPSGDFNEMLQFNSISAGSVIGLLRQLGVWFGNYADTSNYTAYNIPFTDATLSEVFDLADTVFDSLLIDDLDDGDDTTYGLPKLLMNDGGSLAPAFLTAQELATTISSLGLAGLSVPSYDPTTNLLTYSIDLNKVVDFELPVDFSLDLAPLLDIDSSATIALSADAGLVFKFGFDLGAASTVSWSTPLDALNNGGGIDIREEAAITAPNTPNLTYGRLSGDAHFTITVGATDYDVAVAKSQTDTGSDKNTTVADLVADINEALTAASVPAGIQASVSGSKIRLQGSSDFTLTTTSSDPAYREIGFLETHEADIFTPGLYRLTAVKDAPVIVGMQSEDPLTTGTATFNIVIETPLATTIYNVSLDLKETVYNRSIVDLVNDLNKAVVAAGCKEVSVTSQGMQLVFVATSESTASFTVTDINTAGENLGLGALDLDSNRDDFLIHYSDGSTPSPIHLDDVDLDSDNDGTDDLGGVKAAIESQTGGKVTVEMNEAGTGLRLVEAGFNSSSTDTFKVTAINASPAALSLGILKGDVMVTTDNRDGKIEGGPLGGTTLTDRFFIKEAAITGTFVLTTPESLSDDPDADSDTDDGIKAKADFGIVGIALDGGGTLTATVSAGLNDPNSDGRITLTELKNAFGQGGNPTAVIAAPTISGSGNVAFNVNVDPTVLGLGTVGSVDIAISDLGNPFLQTTYTAATNGFAVKAGSSKIFLLNGDQTGTLALGQVVATTLGTSRIVGLNFADAMTSVTLVDAILDGTVNQAMVNTPVAPAITVDVSGLTDLDKFSDLSFEDILASLDELVDFLRQFEAFGFLDYDLPLINRSVNDLVSYVDQFAEAAAEFRANPAGTLQTLENALNSALGAGTGEDFVTLSLDHEEGLGSALKIALDFEKSFSKAINVEIPNLLDLDLSALGLGTLPVDLSGSAGLSASGTLDISLAFGLSLDAASPELFIYEESGVVANLNLTGDDLTFRAALGPVGLYIAGGEISLTPTFTLGLDGASSYFGGHSRTQLTNILGSPIEMDAVTASLTGSISADLPVFFPRDSDAIGSITLGPIDLSTLDLSSGEVFDTLLESLNYSDVMNAIANFDFSKFNIFDNMLLAVDGLGLFLEGAQGVLEGQLFGLLDLPVIGDALDEGAQFLYDLQQDFIEPLRNLVENADDLAKDFSDPAKNFISQGLYDILNPTGVLQSPSFSTSDPEYKGTYGGKVGLTTNLDDYLFSETPPEIDETFIEWTLSLGDTYTLDQGINFDLGLPGLGLETQGEIAVELGWDLDLGFGLSFADGFFIEVGDANELSVWIQATLADGTMIRGTLGFLSLTGKVNESALRGTPTPIDVDEDGVNDPAAVGAAFAINLRNGSDASDTRLGFTELGSLDFEATIAAQAQVGLGLTLAVDIGGENGLPRVLGDFAFDWAIPGTSFDYDNPENSTFVSITDLGNVFQDGLKVVEIRDINLDLGSFVSDVLGPIVDQVKEITEPLQPFIDAITTPIPVISDLVGPTTLLDIAASFGEVDPAMIYAIADIITFVNSIAALDPNGSLLMSFGDLTIYDSSLIFNDPDNPSNPKNGTPIAKPNLWDGNLNLNGAGGTLDSIFENADSLLSEGLAILDGAWFDSALAALSGPAKDIIGKAEDSSADSGGFVFPLFDDPSSVFQLLLGKDIVLVAYDMPQLSFEFEYSQFFTIFGPLGVSINGELGIYIDFAFGYDTYGIRNFVESDFRNVGALLDGFYVSDTDLPTGDFGTDVPELTFEGGLWAAAELNLGVARAGVAGGLFVEINFDLNDPNSDGRVRLAEMAGNFWNQLHAPDEADRLLAPLAVFDVYGTLYAKLFAFLEVDLFFFSINEEWDITPEITILDFELDFFRPPKLATQLDSGDVIINIGEFAADRLRNDTVDGSETFNIAINGNTVSVSATGIEDGDTAQDYTVATGGKVVIKAGEGLDTINITGSSDRNLTLEIDGGAGDDVIDLSGLSGNTVAYISGGAGNDNISGGAGDDIIFGNAGGDTLSGGGGMDLLIGDDVKLFDSSLAVRVGLMDGDDTLNGDAGRDILIGGGGSDHLYGGDEAGEDGDILIGDGVTMVFNSAMTASNLAIGNIVDTRRDLGGMKDYLYGNAGNDWIFGGRGDDEIYGGADADILFGETGRDEIYGGTGTDLIYGDSGRPTNTNGDDDYDLYDQYGRLDLNYEMKPSGDGEGDQLYGGDEDDIIFGSGGNDIISGNAHDDTVFGGGGADSLYGGGGGDRLYGQGGPDLLVGEAGMDTLDGGDGDDVLYGDSRGDLIHPLGSPIDWNETVYGTNTPAAYVFGASVTSGADGSDFNDILISNSGNDFMDGQVGHDIYRIYLQGADNASIVNVYDSGPSSTETDFMHVLGTMYDDNFLLRKSTSLSGLSFVALLNDEPYAERINYWSIEGGLGLERMLVSGLFGKDHFAVDDVGTETTLEGNEDEDSFQVGQLYNSPRDICAYAYNHVAPEDVFATIQTTVGWLSDGINRPMTVYGGTGDDRFTVFHNKAVLSLFGEDGDDTFLIKAFALAGSQEPERERTDVSGGAGVDLVQYAMNAPVNIDGGDGFDRVIVIGTEFGDDIVVTKDGVYGMGLNVNFVNVESLTVDGAEGDDRFYVLSTGEDLITELYGGLGSDTFNMSGDTPPIISNDLKGHSGVITHSVENTGTNYDSIPIDGIAANVADNDTVNPVVVISTPLGVAEIMEGDDLEYYYEILLSKAPVDPVTVQVYAPVQTLDQQERQSKLFSLSSPDEVDFSADRTSISLVFDGTNWNMPQRVYVNAPNISELLKMLNPALIPLDYDDNAIEGDKTGFINHVVTTSIGITGSPDSVSTIETDNLTFPVQTLLIDTDPGIVAQFDAYYDSLSGEFDLNGYMLQIVDGPGAGQSLRIIGYDPDSNAIILGGALRECAGSQVGPDSIYKISRDIEANRAVTVLVHDNDAAEVVNTESDDATVLFEAGSNDTLAIRLGRQPNADVTITLASNDGQLSFSATTLTFTGSNWETPQSVTVDAVDDTVREGFHHGLVTMTTSSADIDTLVTTTETVQLEVEQAYAALLNRPALATNGTTPLVSSVTLNGELLAADAYEVYFNKIVFLTPEGDYLDVIGQVVVEYQFNFNGYHQFDVAPVLTDIADNDVAQVKITQTVGSTDVIEGSGAADGTPWSDTYEVVLTQAPTADVQIRVTPEITKTSAGRIIHWGQQVAVTSDELTATTDGDDVILTFTPDNWDDPQEVIVYASGTYLYGYDGDGAPVIENVDDGWPDGDDTQYFAPHLNTVSDIQGPLYLQGEGGNGSIIAFKPAMLYYELNMMPSTGVIQEVGPDGTTITVDKELLLNAAAELEGLDKATLEDLVDRMLTITLSEGIVGYSEFDYDDDGNNDPIYVDAVGQFRLIVDKVDNGDGTVTLTLNEAWNLSEGETLDMLTKYRLTHMSKNFFANEAEQIDYLFVYNGDSPADNEIASRQGWLTDATTIGYEGNGIVEEFATELGGKRLYGLGMASEDLLLAGFLHPRGVTFGDMEVVEINLGDGNDIFNVEDTHIRSDGYQTWTMINTGLGDDIVYADLDEEGILLTGSLAAGVSIPMNATTLPGDFSTFATDELAGHLIEIVAGAGAGTTREIIANTATGITVNESWNSQLDETTVYRILGDQDGPIAINTEDGNDKVFGSDSTAPLIIFGGDGTDHLYGGSANDIIFGDQGRVEYQNEDEKIVTLLGSVRTRIDPQYVTSAGSQFISDNTADFPVESIDSRGLSGLMVAITDGRGFRQGPHQITENTEQILKNTLTGDAWDPVANADPAGDFDPINPDENPSKYRISLIPEDQTDGVVRDPLLLIAVDEMTGGNDEIYAGSGDDQLFGGIGDDTIYAGSGNDVLFGDLGRMDYTAEAVGDDGPLAGEPVTATLWRVRTTYDDAGGADKLYGGNDDDILLGGFNPSGPGNEDDLSGGFGHDVLAGDNGILIFAPNNASSEDSRDVYLLSAETLSRSLGGADILSGNSGSDLIIGGTAADELYGDSATGSAGVLDGQDILLGDNARVDMAGGLSGQFNFLGSGVSLIETTDTTEDTGGADSLQGNADADIVIGGVGGDSIFGDALTEAAFDKADVILGDNGVVDFTASDDFDPTTVELIATRDTGLGGGDTISGNDGDDIILGGRSGDVIHGNAHDDLIFGDFGSMEFSGTTSTSAEETYDQVFFHSIARVAEITDNNEGDSDTIYGDKHEDILIGGAGSDNIDGGTEDDIIFGDNVSMTRNEAAYGDDTNPRFRTLDGATIYGETGVDNGESLEDVTPRLIPTLTGTPVWQDWDIELLDHDVVSETVAGNNFGNDYLAGGAHDDTIFGQLGDDTIQGDGSIVSKVGQGSPVGASRDSNNLLVVAPSFESATDGDDYIEGNGGDDVIFGNLGQDDIVGDNSSLFSLEDYSERMPSGLDLIFGGAGTDLARNNYGDTDATGHARDADMIMGDNGNIYRLVATIGTSDNPLLDATRYLEFSYDQDSDYEDRASLRIIPRAAELLDYHPGGSDYTPNLAPDSNDRTYADDLGAADEIHGESGDDFIYGMKGSDVLFGEGQDDDLVGGYGNDWISGGTGQDGVIGDDGRIYSSRNDAFAEPLYGIDGFTNSELDAFIYTAGKIQQAYINQEGQLKKTVNLTPFKLGDPNLTQYQTYDPEYNPTPFDPQDADDVIYGGLGSDFLHGGDGDDAISGAEALAQFYNAPENLGNVLRFGEVKAGEFAAYDEYNPLRQVMVDASGVFDWSGSGSPFLLNFAASDAGAPIDPRTTATVPKTTDGDDVLFGDLGNDWLVGGTGTDHLYGGYGSDLLNADDDHSTHGNMNDLPDTDPSYEDIAYGGGGRDVLIGNTGGDRLIDWVGEFNSYLVPYAPYGAFSISRTLQPQLMDYLYALSASDGADPTRTTDTGGGALRNGEPEGELGLVMQKDVDWQSQSGAPDDPQAGNIPGGKRDVLRSATFNTATSLSAEGFAPDSGRWDIQSGALHVSAVDLTGDAVSVYHVDQYLPNYFEITATVNAGKPTAGWKANAYLIFDYQGPDDFKFAGVNASTNKIEMGHRTGAGWIVDVQTPYLVKADTSYNLLLSINGSTATLQVNSTKLFSFNYQSVDADAISGLNQGMVGVGSDRAYGTFDNVAVQKLPPTITYENFDDFSAGQAALLAPQTGTWSLAASRYLGVTAAGAFAISLADLGLESGLAPASVLLLESTLQAAAATKAGFVFDYYGPQDFKFVAMDTATGQLLLGHATKQGVTIDASVSKGLLAGTDYKLGVTLKGSTISVTIDGKIALSHAYNGILVDGHFGLLSSNGRASFDTFNVKTDDPAFRTDLRAAALMAAAPAPGTTTPAATLAAVPTELVEAARAYWQNLLGNEASSLDNLTITVSNLSSLNSQLLGSAAANVITLDDDAAGYGWFVDTTPESSSEFLRQGGATAKSDAAGHMDLLTALTHEMGHLVGFADGDGGGVMDGNLAAGTRTVPVQTATPALGRTVTMAAKETMVFDAGQGVFHDLLKGTPDRQGRVSGMTALTSRQYEDDPFWLVEV